MNFKALPRIAGHDHIIPFQRYRVRSGARSPRAFSMSIRFFIAAPLFGVLFSACIGNPPPPAKLTYTATWQGTTASLEKVSDTVQNEVFDAVIQGQIINFQTNDPKYACFKDQSLNVFEESAEFPDKLVVSSVCPAKAGKPQASSPAGVWTFAKPAPSPFKTTASYNGHTVDLITYNGAIPQGASVQGQVSVFDTTDPTFTCFNATFLNVLVVPAEDKEFAGRFIVSDTCSDGKTRGSWTFTPIYSYHAQWADVQTPEDLTPYLNPIRQAQLPLLGHVHDFVTDDPAYSCLNGTFPEARELKATPTEITAIVYGACTNSVPGAWTFKIEVISGTPYYKAVWQGKPVDLTPLNGNAGTTQPTGQQVTGFQTNDPQYTCFNGVPLNVVKLIAPTKPELTGAYVAYGSCTNVGSNKPGFSQWTFTPQP